MQNNQKTKHLGTFWPLFSIFVAAALLGGIVIGAAYGNILQDQIYSLNLGTRGAKTINAKTQAPAKTPKAAAVPASK